MYSAVAPNDKPIKINIVPYHFPKINPANNASGDPKPADKIQAIVKRKNNIINKIKFV